MSKSKYLILLVAAFVCACTKPTIQYIPSTPPAEEEEPTPPSEDEPIPPSGGDDPSGEVTAVDLSEFGTANTYIVTESATKYSFNALVKGNGIPRSLTWTYDGTSITKSYSNCSIRPSSAQVLWYASPKSASGFETRPPVVLESVKFDNESGKIFFETPENFVNGNVVIAAYDNSNNILWSWTIWAAQNFDVEATAKNVGRYLVMGRNLGAAAGVECKSLNDERAAAHAVGNYYQWGRKDPFPALSGHDSGVTYPWGLPAFTPISALQQSANGYTNVIFTNSINDNAIFLGTHLGTSFTVDQAVEVSIKYPHKWMSNGTTAGIAPHLWAMGDLKNQDYSKQVEWRYLWGSVDGNSSLKTIYDPCPPGWKIPTNDVWMEVMNHITLSPGKRGVYSEQFDIYFPLAGQKKAGNSAFGGVNAVYLASATATSLWYPTRGDMVYYNGQLLPTSYGEEKVSHYDSYGGQATQVRCVKETINSNAGKFGTGNKAYNAILMGDSITEKWPIRGRAEFFTENNYLCKGISGNTTMDMMARFTRDVLDNKPKVVVITAGTNDLAANDGIHVMSEDILNNVRMMAQVAEDYGAKVIIGAVCPSRDFWWKSGDLYKGDVVANRIVNYNAKLKAWAQSKGYAYADYHTALKNSSNDLADAYCWDRGENGLDRVHPNAAGYTVMEGVLKPLIDAALASF